MASSSIKNWHWRTKAVHSWSQQYFEQQLVGVQAAGVAILPGIELEGDAEVGMRKSKCVHPSHSSALVLIPTQTRDDLRRKDYHEVGCDRFYRYRTHRDPHRTVSRTSRIPHMPFSK